MKFQEILNLSLTITEGAMNMEHINGGMLKFGEPVKRFNPDYKYTQDDMCAALLVLWHARKHLIDTGFQCDCLEETLLDNTVSFVSKRCQSIEPVSGKQCGHPSEHKYSHSNGYLSWIGDNNRGNKVLRKCAWHLLHDVQAGLCLLWSKQNEGNK